MEPANPNRTPPFPIGSRLPVAIVATALLGGIVGLGGCALSPDQPGNLQVNPAARTATNSQTTQSTPPTPSPTTPLNRPQTRTRQNRFDASPGQSFTCQTSNYFAQITWQQTQPYLQFGRSPSDISSNTAATESRSDDGSVTYTSRSDQTITVRFLAAGGCTIRVLDLNGNLRVNESGQVGGSGGNGGNGGNSGNGSNGSSTNQGYWDGYNRGFRQGYRDGRNARLHNSGFNPDDFFRSVSPTGNPDFDAGFRVGYFRGFDEGYNSVAVNPTPPPQPEPLPEPLPDPWIPAPGIPGSW